MNTTAELIQATAPNYAGTPLTRRSLTFKGEHSFRDVNQKDFPYDGSTAGDLYDGLCDRLTVMGRLDAGALNTL